MTELEPLLMRNLKNTPLPATRKEKKASSGQLEGHSPFHQFIAR